MISFADFLYPRRCAVCGKTLDTRQRCLCENCLEDIPLTYFWNWRENPAEKMLWGRCQFETVSSLLYYRRESAYSSLTPQVKYLGKRELGLFLGEMLGNFLAGSNVPPVDYLIPVPLHPLRKWKRGYNQAEIIATGIMKGLRKEHRDGPPFLATDILFRKKWSRSQTGIDVGNKWENVTDAFALREKNAGILKNRHILIIDDVLTTGATAEACWNALSGIEDIRLSYAALAFVE